MCRRLLTQTRLKVDDDVIGHETAHTQLLYFSVGARDDYVEDVPCRVCWLSDVLNQVE